MRKNCSSDRGKLLKFEAEFSKILRSLVQFIQTNSERSEKIFVTECFLACFWRFLTSNKLEQLEFKLGKNYWVLETCRKS